MEGKKVLRKRVLWAGGLVLLLLTVGLACAKVLTTPSPPTTTPPAATLGSNPTAVVPVPTSTPTAAVDPTPSPAPDLGTVSGQVVLPQGNQAALRLFFENVDTEEVQILTLLPEQDSYSVDLAPGVYHAYTWLPDFSQMGAHSTCQEDPNCTVHGLQAITVTADSAASGADIVDWYLPEEPLLVLTGRLFDGSGADPLEEAVLVIWDGHVIAVGSPLEVPIPSGVQPYDLEGSTILPGLINTHVHNAYNSPNLETWAQAGVTTVRDLGVPLKQAQPWYSLRTEFAHNPRYARLLVAGPLVTCPDGYPIVSNDFPSLAVRSVEEAPRAIERLINAGADVIKIALESQAGPVLSPDIVRTIVETAHAQSIPVTAHVTQVQDLRRALDAGVDEVAHMVTDYLPQYLIERMVERDVSCVPTLAVWKGQQRKIWDNLSRFVEAGGRVALGNDAGYLSGVVVGMPIREIRAMKRAGMTPAQILVAGTSDAAIVCRRENLLGTLAPGMVADVLVVQGDPLADLEALTAVRMVVHGGVIIRLEETAPPTTTPGPTP
jgi:imidazolonepropionase-like amidohydrolase